MEVVAMDCEMVGLGPNNESGLARCSLVDIKGAVVYDKFIRPEGEITNYRTAVSGVTARHMEKATPFAVARLEVSEAPCASRAKGGGGWGCRHHRPNTDTLPWRLPQVGDPRPVLLILSVSPCRLPPVLLAPLLVCDDELRSHLMFLTLIGGLNSPFFPLYPAGPHW
ncbi:Interferon-stimulated protein 20 kDa protein [Myotis brandtii]|uniref:Interferon-stimulated protein 20 kDa protein n=1 Tax=Myotis brandtii TaxID=109478 RepID=S7MZJ5_MYOBR|nr:Interferon-stimulated protein 20 kDa protein [Myotis brandtii]